MYAYTHIYVCVFLENMYAHGTHMVGEVMKLFKGTQPLYCTCMFMCVYVGMRVCMCVFLIKRKH